MTETFWLFAHVLKMLFECWYVFNDFAMLFKSCCIFHMSLHICSILLCSWYLVHLGPTRPATTLPAPCPHPVFLWNLAWEHSCQTNMPDVNEFTKQIKIIQKAAWTQQTHTKNAECKNSAWNEQTYIKQNKPQKVGLQTNSQ